MYEEYQLFSSSHSISKCEPHLSRTTRNLSPGTWWSICQHFNDSHHITWWRKTIRQQGKWCVWYKREETNTQQFKEVHIRKCFLQNWTKKVLNILASTSLLANKYESEISMILPENEWIYNLTILKWEGY